MSEEEARLRPRLYLEIKMAPLKDNKYRLIRFDCFGCIGRTEVCFLSDAGKKRWKPRLDLTCGAQKAGKDKVDL